MAQHGLFSVFEHSLCDEDLKIRLATASILLFVLEHDHIMIRSFCMAQIRRNQPTLIGLLISRFMQEIDSGLRSQLSEMIRMLIEPVKPEIPGTVN